MGTIYLKTSKRYAYYIFIITSTQFFSTRINRARKNLSWGTLFNYSLVFCLDNWAYFKLNFSICAVTQVQYYEVTPVVQSTGLR